MSTQQTIFLALIGVIVLGGIGVAITRMGEDSNSSNTNILVTDFESCAAAGNAIMESYPRQCRHTDGRLFVEVIDISMPDDISSPCVRAGCSSQLCVSAEKAHDIVTTCEWTGLYGCYDQAVCERQVDGQCGWTETESFRTCVDNLQ